ncbi:MAG: 2-amino-4-hydroxy-6-hydroxymethyldihydropteridine diphosphokinase [Rhodospirillaceae bacterium]|jgi:2-amino-4-hydroxy-6-hydroxymethyldihydropteridine diphosphokinase|nr:2-amino-4-hydroxy-6-hydroxymethyldihydropteridine diphosphokinase [Rhodospirillaceae bacterium]MBT4219361.1 2-amino-4-hydroxy-6-hydroxymethyldihydropteridine diphosphokinase [Rhodospirillaceae bacterium]MBT4464718.1 2-amino-4-hydroxy-6-hydroxymethyldihydropteridine diphosphokinase [Rhodospirillaceae bacterium]MBT5014510.1 2-amino-4-hydroxy-6-hydroxymethyldihydropteridine diphosphokinase [Rhodospirillaceae bacterium]MBT5308140.1 2-amino-4-hydroxy-6-hydroxymethyldihydropteridine diphosphokinas
MNSLRPKGAIIVGIGANLASPEHGAPGDACIAAVQALAEAGLTVIQQSPWYESAPVPVSDQPWYVNGVIEVQTSLSPKDLMGLLAATEQRFGRIRTVRNEARVLDLDLIAYGERVETGDGEETQALVIPHPRLHQRAFVLLPLADILPDWRHPVTGLGAVEMTAALPDGQEIRKLV